MALLHPGFSSAGHAQKKRQTPLSPIGKDC